MNAFGILRIILLVFLIIILVMMIILFSRSLIGIARDKNNSSANVNGAISSALVAANVIIGLLGAYREHFLFTLIFAILQTIIIVFEMFITIPNGWVFVVPWVGSAILAYILAYLIKQGHSSAWSNFTADFFKVLFKQFNLNSFFLSFLFNNFLFSAYTNVWVCLWLTSQWPFDACSELTWIENKISKPIVSKEDSKF